MMSLNDVMNICSTILVGKPLCMCRRTAMVHLCTCQHPCQITICYESLVWFGFLSSHFQTHFRACDTHTHTHIYIYIYINVFLYMYSCLCVYGPNLGFVICILHCLAYYTMYILCKFQIIYNTFQNTKLFVLHFFFKLTVNQTLQISGTVCAFIFKNVEYYLIHLV